MKRIFLIVKSQFIKQLILLKRYWLGTIAWQLMMIIIFLGIYVASGGFTENKDIILINSQVVGFLFYLIIIEFFGSMEGNLSNLTFMGVIEQYVINKTELLMIIFINTLVSIIIAIVMLIPTIIGIFFISGYFKIFISINFIIVFILTVIGVYGLGMIIGGLVLRFKFIGQFAFIIQFLFLGMSAVPLSTMPDFVKNILYFMPFQKGIALLKELGAGVIKTVPTADLIFLLINSLFYLAAGIISFRVVEYYTKKKGILGSY